MTWHGPFDPEFSIRLCLTLLHSFWQVPLCALAAWCLDRMWRYRSVERTYTLNVAAFFASLTVIPITYAMLDLGERPHDEARSLASPMQSTPIQPITSTNSATNSAASIPPIVDRTRGVHAAFADQTTTSATSAVSAIPRPMKAPWWRPIQFAPWIAALYVMGVAVMLSRLALNLARANRLSDRAELINDGPLVDTLRSLARQWSMRVVPALAHAEEIVVPKVMGLARPMILLPASAISGLTTDELRMILAHELAHVRRHDLWIHWVQRLAEAMLFFNPGFWYLSRSISSLREYACDEMVCRELTGSTHAQRVRYATALLRVVELAKPSVLTGGDLASLAASGRTPSELRRRVARLLGEPIREPLRISRGGLLTLILFAATLTVGPSAWQARARAQTATETGQASGVDGANDATDQDDDNAKVSDDSSTFHLTVVGPDDASVPNCSVEIRMRPTPTAEQFEVGEFVRAGNYGTFAKTDDQGKLVLRFDKHLTQFDVSIKQPGYGPYWAGWNATGDPRVIPGEFTARLDHGWSIGGIVVDDEDKPVAGVEVDPAVYYKKRPGDIEKLGVGTNIRTDEAGRWQFDYVPAPNADLHVAFNHPDFQPLRQRLSRNGFEIGPHAESLGRVKLQRGLTVTGAVTDELGNAIAGAVVRTKFLNDRREAVTDEQGRYTLVGCEPRMARIVVSAEGRALDMQDVRIDPEMEPVNFSMKPGGTIRVRVVDEQGNGIPKARIFFQQWRGRQIEYFEFDHVNQYADEHGVWEWNEAPRDEIRADICRPDGMQLSRQPLIARETEHVFQPSGALIVSGRVVDALTKEPIKSFRVIPGIRNRDARIGINWITHDSYEASDGTYGIRMTHDYPGYLVRIEANGYQVATSRDIQTDEGEVEVDFELQPVEDIVTTIVTPTGEAAANAKVALGMSGSQISIEEGDIDDSSTFNATRLDTLADGRISFPPRAESFQLVVTHASGFAYLKSADGPIPDQIQLTPWARVEGTFRVGDQVGPNVVLSMFAEGIHSHGDDVPSIFTSHDVTTGQDGRFVFERVFPGQGRIGRKILLMVREGATEVTSSQRVWAEFTAGETTTLDLGGHGRPVIGKLAPPASVSDRVLWNFALVNVQTELKPPPSPAIPAEIQADPDQLQAWWDAWRITPEGRAWTIAHESFKQLLHQLESEAVRANASIDRDGSFRIDDMPEGDYLLDVRFFESAAPGALSNYRFSVPPPAGTGAREAVDLGTLTLE